MRLSALTGLACAAAASACLYSQESEHDGHKAAAQPAAIRTATARIEPRSGSAVHGVARFVELAGGVEVTITLEGAAPGWHAVHVHEHGDCSAEDAASAGGHFNPGGADHGAPHAAVHHAGDLGNMWVNDDGSGYHKVFMPELTISGDFGVVGRSIIVHEKVDDLVTQPTGAAGGRIGCGEIR